MTYVPDARPDRRSVSLKHYSPPTEAQRRERIAAMWSAHIAGLVKP